MKLLSFYPHVSLQAAQSQSPGVNCPGQCYFSDCKFDYKNTKIIERNDGDNFCKYKSFSS